MNPGLLTALLCASSLVFSQDFILPHGAQGTYEIRENDIVHGTTGYVVSHSGTDKLVISGKTTISSAGRNATITSTTILDRNGILLEYNYMATFAGTRQSLEVSFRDNTAFLVFSHGSVRQETNVELSGNWILMDNNSGAHLALLAAGWNPAMEPRTGVVFVPSTSALADYTLRSVGNANYTKADETIACDLYQMRIADMTDLEFYVKDGRLIAMVQLPEGIEFILRN